MVHPTIASGLQPLVGHAPPFTRAELATVQGRACFSTLPPDVQLPALPALSELRLEACPDLSLDQLHALPGLTRLELVACEVIDLDPLTRLPDLQELVLHLVPCTDAEPLTRCSSLRSLECRGVPWTSDTQRTHLPRLAHGLAAAAGCVVDLEPDSDWRLNLSMAEAGLKAQFGRVGADTVELASFGDEVRGARLAFGRLMYCVAVSRGRQDDFLERVKAEATERPTQPGKDLRPPGRAVDPTTADLTHLEAVDPAWARAARRLCTAFPTGSHRRLTEDELDIIAIDTPGRLPREWTEAARTYLGPGATQACAVGLDQVTDEREWMLLEARGTPSAGQHDFVERHGLYAIAQSPSGQSQLAMKLGTGGVPPVIAFPTTAIGPDGDLDRRLLTPRFPSFPALLDAITALRLPDGTIIEAQD